MTSVVVWVYLLTLQALEQLPHYHKYMCTAAVLHFLIKEVWNISIFCEFSKFYISSHNFMSNSLVQ